MNIRPPTTSVTAAMRFIQCQDAIEPHIWAALKKIGKPAPRHGDLAEFLDIKAAARLAGWNAREIHLVTELVLICYLKASGEQAQADRIISPVSPG